MWGRVLEPSNKNTFSMEIIAKDCTCPLGSLKEGAQEDRVLFISSNSVSPLQLNTTEISLECCSKTFQRLGDKRREKKNTKVTINRYLSFSEVVHRRPILPRSSWPSSIYQRPTLYFLGESSNTSNWKSKGTRSGFLIHMCKSSGFLFMDLPLFSRWKNVSLFWGKPYLLRSL